ncbi:MAG: hypothetical protein HYX96_06090 [Chloroflexi bacterium]|nr:hypothetical protein [Chloroflexota bacterium]
MLDNNTYNLFSQLVEEHRSLWRIKDTYKKDASDSRCLECIAFWDRMVTDKEERIKELVGLIKEHLK